MRLHIQKHSTVIYINENSSLFHSISRSMQERFKKTFWVNNILVNLPEKGEESKRKLFLLELYKKCAKKASAHNIRFLKKLLAAADKPIKLLVQEITMPVKVTNVSLHVKRKKLLVKLEDDDTLLFWYLVNKFKAHDLKHNFFKKEFFFKTFSKELENDFISLFTNPNVFGKKLHFSYSKLQFKELFKGSESNIKIIEKDPLEECYKTLHVNKGEHLETIRRKYLKLAKMYHPDGAINSNEIEKRTQKFQKIQEAYHTIKAQIKTSA